MSKLTQVLRSATSSDDPYCPDVGDIIELNFDPQAGREQAGKRPAIVLSSRPYNELTRLCVLCPITSQAKGFNFEVLLPEGGQVVGAVLADHVKSLSWQARGAKFLCRSPDGVLVHVKAKIRALISIT